MCVCVCVFLCIPSIPHTHTTTKFYSLLITNLQFNSFVIFLVLFLNEINVKNLNDSTALISYVLLLQIIRCITTGFTLCMNGLVRGSLARYSPPLKIRYTFSFWVHSKERDISKFGVKWIMFPLYHNYSTIVIVIIIMPLPLQFLTILNAISENIDLPIKFNVLEMHL